MSPCKAPNDLKNLVRFSKNNRLKTLEVKDFRSSYGERAFSVCGPKLWNCLPIKLRFVKVLDVFKKDLKTYLFEHGDAFYNLVHMK